MASNPQLAGRRLLVLGAGPAQLGLLRAARERGLYVVACDRDPLAVGFEYADRRAIVSTEDEPAVGRLAQAERVEGVVSPGSDWPVAIAARVAARLGLPHPLAPEAAAVAVSKTRQRERFREAGVPQPRWSPSAEAVDEIGFPCVVKAADRQGQRGLTFVRDPSELAGAVELALRESRSGTLVVEEHVEGPELTVNAFSIGGVFHPLTVTDRLTADPPAFGVALAHAWPSSLAPAPAPAPARAGAGARGLLPESIVSPESARVGNASSRERDGVVPHVAAAVEVARLAAEAVGVTDGPTYTQVRIGAEGPKAMELAARLGGGHDAELCLAALGVDLNGLALAAALGEPVAPPLPQPRGGACVRFLVAPEGELAAVAGLEDALEVDGVLAAHVYRRPGWRFGPLRRGSDRAGFVLAVGGSRDHALERAGLAMERIRFETVDVEAPVEA
ncbi:MAG TPA: hypothetical protein VJK66_00085 [Gaiellaceae bacterium]|nr:hypothetical protein [Gaiellaceae bacterium]